MGDSVYRIYSSKEIEVLESYSHRLNNKIHITFPGGACGDMLWASIFVTLGVREIEDTSEVCPITPEGRTLFNGHMITEGSFFAFKTGEPFPENYKSRHDILFSVYIAVNEANEGCAIKKIDDYNVFCHSRFPDYNYTVVDTILSHCCTGMRSDTIALFETEFNQKMIFIVPNDSDADLYGQMCNTKTDINREYDYEFRPYIWKILDNITPNALVINPNRFITSDKVYRDCIEEILQFTATACSSRTIDKMVAYRTKWFNKQPKDIIYQLTGNK